jgi:subtilisin family serine protease
MQQSGINLNHNSINLNASNMGTAKTTSNVDFSAQLRRVLAHGTAAAGQATSMVGNFVPGAAVMSAVLNNSANSLANDGLAQGGLGGAGLGTSLGGGLGLGFGAGIGGGTNGLVQGGNPDLMSSMQHMQENMMSMNMYMLGVQRKFQQMSEQYTTISNVLKTKHDTEKNSINNIR